MVNFLLFVGFMTDLIIPPTPSRDEYLDNGPREMGWLQAEEPISLFETWLAKAGETEPNDPNAMSLATAGQMDILMSGLFCSKR